jgi:hypothetical protein
LFDRLAAGQPVPWYFDLSPYPDPNIIVGSVYWVQVTWRVGVVGDHLADDLQFALEDGFAAKEPGSKVIR